MCELGVREDTIEQLRVHDWAILTLTGGIISGYRTQVHTLMKLQNKTNR